MRTFSDYDNLNDKKDEIQANIDVWNKGVQGEIYVINDIALGTIVDIIILNSKIQFS